MAQTLNPSASVFRPTFHEDMNLDFESYLPDRLLVSPHKHQRRSFEVVPFCRSPREYTSYHYSELPFRGEPVHLEQNSFWDEYSVSSLQQEFMKMERELGRAPRHLNSNSKPLNYEAAKNNHDSHRQSTHRSSTTPPVRHNYQSQRAPKQMNQKFTNAHRRTSQKKVTDFNHAKQHNQTGLLPKYDVECLLHLVRSQLEFYFSDQNLYEEMHSNLQYYMKLDSQKWVPVHVLLALPSVAKLTTEKEVVLQALRSSNLLELNSDESKCRRPNYVTPADYKVRKNLRRSVLVYGLPEQMTDEEVRGLLDMHGNILCVAFAGMDEGPDCEIGSVIMKKKFNDLDIDNLKTAFVVFESQSQANKCVKARSRHSIDGIRTMHKYDYNKVVKRLGKGQSPLMTPVPAPNSFPSTKMNIVNNRTNFNSNAPSFPMNTSGNKRMPFHHQTTNSAAQSAPSFLKRNQNNSNVLKNNTNQDFRKKTQKWRSPTKGSDSLNWRLNNSPMRQRTNSNQNRSTGTAIGGEFSKFRNSKENVNTYPLLQTRTF